MYTKRNELGSNKIRFDSCIKQGSELSNQIFKASAAHLYPKLPLNTPPAMVFLSFFFKMTASQSVTQIFPILFLFFQQEQKFQIKFWNFCYISTTFQSKRLRQLIVKIINYRVTLKNLETGKYEISRIAVRSPLRFFARGRVTFSLSFSWRGHVFAVSPSTPHAVSSAFTMDPTPFFFQVLIKTSS